MDKSASGKKHTCTFVLSKLGEWPVRYCGSPVRFHMEYDDDHNMVRMYQAFCQVHQPIADAMGDEEDM